MREQITPWTKPDWTKHIPREVGYYWYLDAAKDSQPEPVELKYDEGNGDPELWAIFFDEPCKVEDLCGHWMELLPPERP